MEVTPKTSKGPPSGTLAFHEAPAHTLPSDVLHRLAEQAHERHPLEGAYANLEDKVILALEAPDRDYLRVARQRHGAFCLLWMWQTNFGSMGTVTAWVGVNQSFGRFCADGHLPIWDRINEGETPTYLVICREGTPTFIALADRLGNAVGEIEKNRPGVFLVHDPRVAYWQLFELTDSWKRRITVTDRLQFGWAGALHAELFRQSLTLDTANARCPAHEIALPEEFSTLRAVWNSLLTKAAPGAQWIYTITEELVRNGNFLSLVVESSQAAETVPNFVPFHSSMQRLLLLAALRPEVTQCGRRLPYWQGFVEGVTFEGASYKELPAARLEPEVEKYWRRACPDLLNLFSQALPYIDPTARPVDLTKNQQALARVKVSDPEACRTSADALLDEAEACQQWTVPPGALVELPIGPIARWQVWQFADEFAFVAWTAEGEYAIGGLNLARRSLRVPCPALSPSDITDEVEAALYLMMASIVRDFLVVEERETAWSTREKSRIPGLRPPPHGKLVIYIARRRYRAELAGEANTGALETELNLKHRARHSVRAHVRRINGEASPVAPVLAQRYGLMLGTGYTFVKPHVRGGVANRDVIYGGEEVERAGGVVQWFQFEREVRALMKGRGLSVEHVSADRKGDGGVDVYAWDEASEATYAVQAKCWQRTVGPEVVRELVGALTHYPEGTKGIIVTTSKFTSAATEEAASQGIELIDGSAFLAEVHRSGIVLN